MHIPLTQLKPTLPNLSQYYPNLNTNKPLSKPTLLQLISSTCYATTCMPCYAMQCKRNPKTVPSETKSPPQV